MEVVYGREFVYTYYMSEPVESRLRLHESSWKPCCVGMGYLLKWGLLDAPHFFEGDGGRLSFRIHRDAENELVDRVRVTACPDCGAPFTYLFSGTTFYVHQRPKKVGTDGKPSYEGYRAIGKVDISRFLKEVRARLASEADAWRHDHTRFTTLEKAIDREMTAIFKALNRAPDLTGRR